MLIAQQFEWGQAFGGNQNDNAQRISTGSAGSVFVVWNCCVFVAGNAAS